MVFIHPRWFFRISEPSTVSFRVFPDSDHVRIRFGHWGCGWWLAIRFIPSFGDIDTQETTVYGGSPMSGLPSGKVADRLVPENSTWGMNITLLHSLKLTESLPLKIGLLHPFAPKGNEKVFQSIFRCYVSFREGVYIYIYMIYVWL